MKKVKVLIVSLLTLSFFLMTINVEAQCRRQSQANRHANVSMSNGRGGMSFRNHRPRRIHQRMMRKHRMAKFNRVHRTMCRRANRW